MHTPQSHQIVRAGGKSALLVEGGALRGSYAVGVLRTLHEHGGADQFDAIVAVSSGVFAATYFAAGQVEDMENTWRDRVHGSQLISFRRPLMGQAILGLDYLISLFKGPVYLDLDRVRSSRPTLSYVVTNYRTGAPYYANAKSDHIFEFMKASAGLPWLYHRPIVVEGVRYCDGSVSDPLPIRWLIEQGFTEIVAVLTTPDGYRNAPISRITSSLLFPFSRGVRAAARRYYTNYTESTAILLDPPAGVRIVVMRPSANIAPVLTRNRQRIIDGIELGKRDARRLCASLRDAAQQNAVSELLATGRQKTACFNTIPRPPTRTTQ